MMFEIVKYDFNLTELGEQEIRIDFRYHGTLPKTIQVKVVNPTFTKIYHVVGGESLVVQPQCQYWVATTISKPFDIKFNMDSEIEFIDALTEDILECYPIPTFSVDIRKRSLGENYTRKNVWVMGDSHVDFFFNRNIKDNIFHHPKYTLNPVSNAALTINRFTKRDYLKFLSAYPIYKGDVILFMLGEIDCRVSLKRNAKLKGLDIKTHIQNIVSNYKTALDIIQSRYPDCIIKVTNALPPLPDGWISTDSDDLIGEWGLNDRIQTRNIFEKELQSKVGGTYQIIDITPNLTTKEGIANTQIMLKDDIHYKFTNIVIDNIKKQLNG